MRPITSANRQSQTLAFEWSCNLGLEGVRAEMDFSGKSLKSQMKRADRLGAEYVLIVGDAELEQGAATLRIMQSKAQESIPLDNIVATIQSKLS